MQADCELGADEKYVANLDSTSAHKLDILKSNEVFVKNIVVLKKENEFLKEGNLWLQQDIHCLRTLNEEIPVLLTENAPEPAVIKTILFAAKYRLLGFREIIAKPIIQSLQLENKVW